MTRWIGIALAAVVMMVGGVGAARGDDGTSGTPGPVDCPDERACNVGTEFTFGGASRRCGLGLKIFGVGGAIWGEVCWDHETMVPAHQECHGAPNRGTRCVPDGEVAVKTRDCKCGGGMLPLIDTGIPLRCVCTDWLETGKVEDFKTEEC